MNNYKVVYSPLAIADMDEAWDEVWASSENFDVADNYISELMNKVDDISKHPKTGERLIFDDVFTGIYYVTHKKYSAFYRIRQDYIEVGRVLYNRSDYIKKIIGCV